MRERTVPPAGYWIPWIFVAFFAVVFAVNGTMLYFALDSWTGLSDENAFQQGLAYNDKIAERDRQAALGWQVSFDATPDRAGHVLFALQVDDDRGMPVTAASVVVSLTRPTHEGHDLAATLTHRGRGYYAGEADLPLSGQWHVELVIDEPRGSYRQGERVIVP